MWRRAIQYLPIVVLALSPALALAQALLQPTISAPASISPNLPTEAPASAPVPTAIQPATQNAPVTFTADEVQYDQNAALVMARGRVEAFQGGRVLRADELTYNRNSGVATARGNVQLIEADGQVMFAESAELSNQMRDGVLEGLRGYLLQNGRIAATGARRTDGSILDLSRVLYTVCDPCKDDPLAPPLWQLRARTATLDRNEQQVRYRGASLDMAGVPVMWLPYFQHPDGSAARQSGFLSPSFGITKYLGGFIETPYYWAIDESQELVLRPTTSTRVAPNLGLDYRRRFNSGEMEVLSSIGHLDGQDGTEEGFAGHIFAKGRFSLDETWRAGFDANRASSDQYLRIYRYGSQRILPTTVFTEGFWGPEAFARFDARAYQGLRSTDDISQIPLVLPNIYADWESPEDSLGGRFTLDTSSFAIFRGTGTSTRRASSRVGYALPRMDDLGGIWTLRAQSDLAAYDFENINLAPNYAAGSPNGQSAAANIRAALDWRMPFLRDSGDWGSQVVEPRIQLVTGPMTGSQYRIPNEDSIVFDFTDANLFSLNRFTGRDRQEGGTRADMALRSAWFLPENRQLEALVGRSFRVQEDGGPFYPNSGLVNRASDWVSRLTFRPTSWMDLTGRARRDGESFASRAYDISTTVRPLSDTSFTLGYLQAPPMPYLNPVAQREEVYLGATQRLGLWRVSASVRQNIELNQPVAAALSALYEDECFIFETRFVKNYAEDPATNKLYPGATMLLFRFGFKTIGDFGARAL
ncbi:MAG: LPS-assembly protein LptD [Acetobacteraceae bacterium]|jgi:LPS-assembly protein|nr:LPS-assembly protein LptD [Acetobacteraceae bacterium]